jgi:hypothetical protein
VKSEKMPPPTRLENAPCGEENGTVGSNEGRRKRKYRAMSVTTNPDLQDTTKDKQKARQKH